MAFVLPLLSLLVSACFSAGNTRPEGDTQSGNRVGKILACKAMDRQIARSDQCLQDDAASYHISDGQWFTGERAGVCPAVSTPIPAG